MLSKNKIKLIKSLDEKKKRKETNLFLAEGRKVVGDCLPYFKCELLVATPEWLSEQKQWKQQPNEIIEASHDEIKKASLLKSPQEVLAVFRQPDYAPLKTEVLQNSLVLALDTIQDPGNLGTIVRIADWFGIEHIVCSPDTADIYNPKVVQATMGAIARVRLHYQSLTDFFQQPQMKEIPIYGTFLNGKDLYATEITPNGIIIMGNEGNGISKEIEPFVNNRLFIPNYPSGRDTSESLNVAIATAITCAEFRRRTIG